MERSSTTSYQAGNTGVGNLVMAPRELRFCFQYQSGTYSQEQHSSYSTSGSTVRETRMSSHSSAHGSRHGSRRSSSSSSSSDGAGGRRQLISRIKSLFQMNEEEDPVASPGA